MPTLTELKLNTNLLLHPTQGTICANMFRISWLVTIISTAISSFDNMLNLCTKCSMSFLLIPLTFSQSTQLSLNCTTICKLKTQINYCLKLQWNMKNNKYIKLCSCIHSFVITVELFFAGQNERLVKFELPTKTLPNNIYFPCKEWNCISQKGVYFTVSVKTSSR